jgi:hypothetical protein
MKLKMLLAAMLLCGSQAYAQNNDPTVMTINGLACQSLGIRVFIQ